MLFVIIQQSSFTIVVVCVISACIVRVVPLISTSMAGDVVLMPFANELQVCI